MQSAPKVPKLDLEALKRKLDERFCEGFSKLSDIPDPSLLLNAPKAAKRIADAVRNNQRITLVGDYDVDGVTATALTTLFFRELGYPLDVIIPNRFSDGYGVSPSVLERVEADLVFTVDNGINAYGAAEVCKARGIDLIITDHHTPSDMLPDAYTIVDPKLPDDTYPFKEICGAQVAWLVLVLVKKELALDINMSQYLSLLALAVVADVMPLIGINRAIVQHGLQQMGRSSLPAFVIIREFLNRSALSAEDIGFQIAPRINSAGRLEDASIALEFLTAESTEIAFKRFELLKQLNDLRKSIEADVTEEAISQVSRGDDVIVVAGEDWNEGVVGIVASRLVHRFGRPAIVLSITEGRAKGSARSIGSVSIYALIKSQEMLLEGFGGHMMAAGLAMPVDNVAAFKAGINAVASKIDPEAFTPQEELIGELAPSAINHNLLQLLDAYEPFGEANPRPRFLAKDAYVASVTYMGKERDHSRIGIQFEGGIEKHDLIAFKQRYQMPGNRRLCCSYTISKNEWNGKISLQMMLDKLYGYPE
jgi:single-stranded-DNA-specific exonuclease